MWMLVVPVTGSIVQSVWYIMLLMKCVEEMSERSPGIDGDVFPTMGFH